MSAIRTAYMQNVPDAQLPRLDALLRFLAERLAAPDYAEAESLLHAAIDPQHAARRHREAAAGATVQS